MTTQPHLRQLMLVGTLTLALGSTGCSSMKAVSAASQGDLATLQQLHGEGKNIHGKDLKMTTALYRAVEAGQTDIVTFLLDNSADINASNGFSKRTALMTAVDTDNAAMVTLLLERGADVNQADRKDNTPLTLAVDAGKGELAALLLNGGADPDHAGETTLTPLITSLKGSNLPMATLLLEAGANPDLATGEPGVPPIHVAMQKQNQAMLELLIAHGVDLEQQFAGSTALMDAVILQQVELAETLLAHGADAATTSNAGIPALFYALSSNRAMAARLLEAGADANAPIMTHSSQSLLERTVAANDLDALLLLLEQGGTVTDSALHTAVSTADIDTAITAALLATGVTPDGTLEQPNVAAAAKIGNLETLNLLLAAGASPSPLASATFDPPLMYAAKRGQLAMVDALLAAGADVAQQSNNGNDSLYQATYYNQTTVIQRLIAAGADVNNKNGSTLTTPLKLASYDGHEDVILALITAGADPNLPNSDGFTALYTAAQQNHPTVVTMLLAAGADPALAGGQSKWTPAHKAAYEGNSKALENLLKYGADANARAANGDTPMDLAMRNGRQYSAQMLGSYGGKINNYTAPKQSSGDTFGKVFATAAIAGLASSADIPSYATADIMSATVKDIWIENGQGNNLAQMQQQYAKGNFEIQDPTVRQVFSATLESEKETKRLIKQLETEQAAQRKLQQQQRQQLQAQRQATQAENRRRQQQLAQQQQALAEQQARQQQLRQQQQQQRERQQAARTSQAAAPVQVAYRNEPPAPASTRRAPSARQGSIQQGNMQASDKLNCPSCEGSLTQRNVTIGECTLSSITVAYDVGVFFGEPVVRGDYKWRAAAGTPEDCLDSSFAIWLKIQNGGASGYVKVDPVVPKAGQESFSGGAGSPDWDEFICGFNGKQKTECFAPDDAKTLLKKGRITSFTYSVQ